MDNYKSHRKSVEDEINKAIQLALDEIGQHVVGEAMDITPVGQYKNGKVGGRLRAGNDYQTVPDESKVIVGNNVEYAPWVHNGTRRQSPQPFLTTAINMSRDEIKKITEKHLSNGMK